LDGPQSVQDAHRVPGAFNDVMNALKAARRNGKTVWVNSVLSRINLDCVPWLIETAQRNEIQISFQLLYHTSEIAGSTEDMLPSADQYRSVVRRIREAKRLGAPVINSYPQLDYLEKWPDYRNPFFSSQVDHRCLLRCWGGRLFLHVEPNGAVFPCSQLMGQPMIAGRDDLHAAVSNAARHACRYCCLGADYVEYNLLMGLNPKAVWNAMRLV
jgi:sulfatase maturation enzyme AslB (radical SAM superfamily)